MADVNAVRYNQSDLRRDAKTQKFSTADNDGDRLLLIQVPRATLVKNVFIEVLTAFSAGSTGAVTVGYKDADGFDVDSFGTDAEVASEVLGLKLLPRARYFAKPGVITVSLSKGDSAADFVGRLLVEMTTIY